MIFFYTFVMFSKFDTNRKKNISRFYTNFCVILEMLSRNFKGYSKEGSEKIVFCY